jgi:hypothetical protein
LAEQRGHRDFWLVCATISILGVLFAQTRTGMVALIVTGTIFFAPRPAVAARFFCAAVIFLLLLGAAGLPRFSVGQLRSDAAWWVDQNAPVLRQIDTPTWLFGGARPQLLIVGGGGQHSRAHDDAEDSLIPNMHITLVLEHGIAAWLVVMGLIVSALREMKEAHDRTDDRRLKAILWAIISSVIGFVISMNGLNTFHYLTLEIFFWSLIGIGLGIVIHVKGRARHSLIWRFGDAGD